MLTEMIVMKDKPVIDMEPFLNMCFKQMAWSSCVAFNSTAQMDQPTEILLGSGGF